MNFDVYAYNEARQSLLKDDCRKILKLEENVTNKLSKSLLDVASDIKKDFDTASQLKPYWEKYAPFQRGHKPRGEAFPWGEVGEKVIEGYVYSLAPRIFDNVRFVGVPYGHDIRFLSGDSFVHIDTKSTGPTDNAEEVVSSPNQVTGTGKLEQNCVVYNDMVEMRGKRVRRDFQPELAPFYIIDDRILPTLTFYIKVVYSVKILGNQPLEYLEIICVPNGLILFDGPKLINKIQGLFTPGKDEVKVVRKRTRIKLKPLSQLDSWRCQKIKFDRAKPYIEFRSN